LKADKYRNFQELEASEPADAWRIVPRPLGTDVAIIAPHGGGIERGTSELATAIAGAELSLYLFEGLKTYANSELHITSSHFDEPQGMAIVRSAMMVVALHGAAGKKPVVYLGGLNMEPGQAIAGRLQAAGFDVDRHPGLQGASSANICNRGTSGQGVQLELTMSLRAVLPRYARSRPPSAN
jgi:phage replication-related protein YjqB (UPF0714/DUF867 family)